MATKVSTLSSRMLSAAANVATQMGGGTSTAEVQALARLLDTMSRRRDLWVPVAKYSLPTDMKEILPG